MRSAFSLKIGYYGLTAQLGEGRGRKEKGRDGMRKGEFGMRKWEGGRRNSERRRRKVGRWEAVMLGEWEDERGRRERRGGEGERGGV